VERPVARLTPSTAEPPQIGGAPNVREVDGQLRVEWPSPRRETFLMTSSLFESMIADINGAKRLVAALERIRLTIDELD